MPELPEVETIARQLDKVLSGKVFKRVTVYREKSARNNLSKLKGKSIKGVTRRAKYILIEIDEDDLVLVVHLKMTGQIVYLNNAKRVAGGHPTSDWVGKLPSSHTRIELEFGDRSKLFFNDQRVFGWMELMSRSDLNERIVDGLPPDVVDKEFDYTYLKDVLSRSRRSVKLVILDQKKMGGMGNIYANDALHMAGIHPGKQANSLSKKEGIKLRDSMVKAIRRGIELGGATYSDFVDVDGVGGSYQDEFVVYGREGKKCPRQGCGGRIVKIKLGGRGTYYCIECQTL